MSTGTLTIDLGALVQNWLALDAMTDCDTAAVVKADGYGLGAGRVASALAAAGARQFFVAVAQEGVALRKVLGPDVVIAVFSGHMEGDTALIRDADLIPMLNSVDQMVRHVESIPDQPFGVQLDTGMNRLGMEPGEWAALRDIALAQNPVLLMSHLACADDQGHPMNRIQLRTFRELTADCDVPLSLAATGGILLGQDYHFDLTRPGVGLYGGAPFEDAGAVVTLDLPVIQVRTVMAGETVGYGNSWTAPRDSRIATISAGYADGLIRAMSGRRATVYADGVPCQIVGRVSMDLITADITDLNRDPASVTILNTYQTVDDLAGYAETIGYEILTSMGARYARRYTE
ncbi:MAG: alanine racemase [Rhodobacteraceae bacterium]|nr:alanine racemase [Paracoccaceae bacterium]